MTENPNGEAIAELVSLAQLGVTVAFVAAVLLVLTLGILTVGALRRG